MSVEIIHLDDIQVGDVYDIETSNRHYTLERRKDGLYICGHPSYCGLMTRCFIHGSCPSGFGPMEKHVIRVGAHLDLGLEGDPDDLITSAIKSITKSTGQCPQS